TSLPEPGGTITYTVTVKNTSAAGDPFTNDTPADDTHSALAGDVDCKKSTTLDPGASYDFTFTGSVGPDAGDYKDVVTVTGHDDEQTPVEGTDDATVTVTHALHSIPARRSSDLTSLPEPGGTITYTVTVKNTSAAGD